MQELKDLFRDTDRAVSPVIGVILMVAITVILAAVIGTFVLDLGSSTSQNPQAGVSFEQTGSSTVTVTLTSAPRVDTDSGGDFRIDVDQSSGGGDCATTDTQPFSNVGDSVDCGGGSGNTITVVAYYSGKTAVISTYTP